MAPQKKTAVHTFKDSVSAFGEIVQREAQALAESVTKNFAKHYRLRAAKRKRAKRTSVKSSTRSGRKTTATRAQKIKTAPKRHKSRTVSKAVSRAKSSFARA